MNRTDRELRRLAYANLLICLFNLTVGLLAPSPLNLAFALVSGLVAAWEFYTLDAASSLPPEDS